MESSLCCPASPGNRACPECAHPTSSHITKETDSLSLQLVVGFGVHLLLPPPDSAPGFGLPGASAGLMYTVMIAVYSPNSLVVFGEHYFLDTVNELGLSQSSHPSSLEIPEPHGEGVLCASHMGLSTLESLALCKLTRWCSVFLMKCENEICYICPSWGLLLPDSTALNKIGLSLLSTHRAPQCVSSFLK